MTPNEQIDAFSIDIGKVIDRYRREFDLSYAAAVGTLMIHAHRLMDEGQRSLEDDDDE